MGFAGGDHPRKRIRIAGRRAAGVVRALAEAQGHAIVTGDREAIDLLVLEVSEPREVALHGDGAPLLAVVDRRLRALESRAFREAGASAVVDAEASVLDLAFALSDLLFGTYVEQRRYGRVHGRTPVRFGINNGLGTPRANGVLLDIGRSGAFILSDHRIEEGTPIEMEIGVLDRTIALRGRVAFGAESAEREMAVEFALDDHEVAPKLYSICCAENGAAVSRAASSSGQ